VRADIKARYSFETIFMHLSRKHTQVVGPVRSFFGPQASLNSINSFRLAWPRRLPILADHHVPTGKWDPNDRTPYVRLAVVDEKPAQFTDVTVGRLTRLPRHGESTMTELITYAGLLFKATKLDARLKTKIALRYAVDCYPMLNRGSDPLQDPNVIHFLPVDLFKVGLGDLFDGFRCRYCTDADSRLSRHTAKVFTPGTLFDHFRLWHSSVRWYKIIHDIPTDEALSRALSQPGMEAAMAAYNQLFPGGFSIDPVQEMVRNGFVTLRKSTNRGPPSGPKREAASDGTITAAHNLIAIIGGGSYQPIIAGPNSMEWTPTQTHTQPGSTGGG
jgi:hypothetical protein